MVKITKEGLKSFEWSGELQQEVEVKVPSFLRELRSACEIDEGVTLGDVFKAVSADQGLVPLIEAYSWCDVRAFHAEAAKSTIEESGLTVLEVGKFMEIDEDDGGVQCDFEGIGPPDARMLNEGETRTEIRWGIALTPVNQLVNLPVVLNHSAPVMKEYNEVGRVNVTFSLLEVLDAIYFEISFHGSPRDRAFGAELMSRVAEVEAGTAKLVPWNPDEETVQ